MEELMVGFITPQNEKIYMYYDEVNDFCKAICESSENVGKFTEFRKKYTYFYPYFDFVMFELDYVFINPLLEKETYLKKAGNALYKIDKYILDDDENAYDHISTLAKGTKNGGNYPWLVACSDKELRIREVNINDIHKCMIDPNGMTHISTSDGEKDGNHEVTANTIANQLLISSRYLWKTYDPNHYAVSYLIEKFGFIRADDIEYGGMMIGLEQFLSDKVKEFCDRCVKEKNCIFRDWGNYRKFQNEEVEYYEVRGR